MARKAFNTSVDEEVAKNFKESCANIGINMNVVLETMMEAFIKKDLVLRMEENKFFVASKS